MLHGMMNLEQRIVPAGEVVEIVEADVGIFGPKGVNILATHVLYESCARNFVFDTDILVL